MFADSTSERQFTFIIQSILQNTFGLSSDTSTGLIKAISTDGTAAGTNYLSSSADWSKLSGNPNAIELLKENPNKIKWGFISLNPSIFTYDYEKIKENNKELNEEIIIKALHPKRMLRLMEIYGEDEIYNCFFDDD